VAWFSACVRLAVLVEGIGINSYWQSVFVFRSSTRDEAFVRALELGLSLETTYPNAEGHEVRWRLAEVQTLDELASDDIDGAEVYSEPFAPRPDEEIPFDADFRPEERQPLYSGI
jgi:hypothetical protein